MSKNIQSMDKEVIQKYAVRCNIEWNFNPPSASHMGGVWERMIRTIRKVFTGLLDRNARLTDDILTTLFGEVESLINNRPLTKQSDDITDVGVLTPNHLLLFREGPRIPPDKFNAGDMYRRRWKYVQHLTDRFWKRWISHYLPDLQKRQKWLNKSNNIQKGDIVLVVNETTPRNLWPMGIVVDVNQGRDSLVRSVRLKTKSGEILRPVTKLVQLEANLF